MSAKAAKKKGAGPDAPAARGKPVVREKSAVRDRILKVASRLVRKHGPAGATARAICEAAGITAPTLYHYFNDLNGLYAEILVSIFVEYQADQPPDEVTEPVAMIDDIWDRLMHNAHNEAGVVDLLNRQLSNGQVPDILRGNYERLATAFEQLSKDTPMKVSSKVAAHMFWAGAQGMASLIVASRHGVPYPKGTAEAFKASLLHGIFEADTIAAGKPRAAQSKR